MEQQPEVINNEQQQRFEVNLGNDIAYIEYRWLKNNIVLMHTLVPEKYEGKGIAGTMAKFALEYIKEKKWPLVVYCPYITAYMKKHPEYNELLARAN